MQNVYLDKYFFEMIKVYLCKIGYVINATEPKDIFDSYNYTVRFSKFAFCIKKSDKKYIQISSKKEFLTPKAKYQFYIGEYMITEVHPLDYFLTETKQLKNKEIVCLEEKFNNTVKTELKDKNSPYQNI